MILDLKSGAYAIGRTYSDLYITGFEGEAAVRAKESLDKGGLESFGFLVESETRSQDSFRYALAHAEQLFTEGRMQNRDVAIVIGVLHSRDYSKFEDQIRSGELDYNLVYIYPIGL